MTWIQWCAVGFLVSCVSAPLIGEGLRYLRNRRTNQQFNQTLVGAAARARKAKIDQWLSDEEEAYLKRIQAHYGSAAEVATRMEELNKGAVQAGVPPMLLITEDDYHAWQTDEDEQPHGRPAA